jgi:hypothetical protein
MDWQPSTFRRGVLAWGLVPLVVAGHTAEKPHPPGGREKVSVTFNLLATFREGATVPMASMGPIDLAAGEGLVGAVSPFAFGAEGGSDGCGAGLAIEQVEATLERYPIAWTADVKVEEANTDRIVLSGRWERFAKGAGGRPIRAAGASMPRLSLHENERVLLDLVEPPSSGGSRCMRNFALELTARLTEDPALASRQIAYDLWLLHETKEGTKAAAHTQLTGTQGERVSVSFPAQTLPARAGSGARDRALHVTFTGHVRGRVRSDGTIALALNAMRSLSYVAPDGSTDGGMSEGGEKGVELEPGEAVRLEVPDPIHGAARGEARATRMARDLAGHSFALVCRARPQPH